MKVEVVGKNGFRLTEAIEGYVVNKLQKIEQFFANGVIENARVVCKVYNDHHKVEITIPTKNLILRSEVCDDDMYAAIDKSIDKLISQVRRHKDKVKGKLEKEGIKQVFKNDVDLDLLEKEVMASQLVKNKKIDLRPMTVEEAIDQMELLGHSFFIFLNSSTQKVCVTYLRDDGNYAVIETN